MTLNDLERRNSPYFAFLPNFIVLMANYVTVVKRMTYNVYKILSPSFSLPLLTKTNPPCSAVSLRSWAICIQGGSKNKLFLKVYNLCI